MPNDINTSGRYGGMDFKQFHKQRIARYTGFANQHDTNFDHFIYAKDVLDWNWYLALDEQHKALSIDYAHGLELDDWGDDVGLARNGLDDDKYRFLIKLKRLTINSKGTYPDIIRIAASLLGCQPSDISISSDRKWVNGQLVGEENTINIDSIDITKINNTEFIPILASELQSATLASTKIRQVGFYDNIPFTLYLGAGLAVAEQISVPIPDEQRINRTLTYQLQLGTGLVISEEILVDGKNHANVDEFMKSDVYLAATANIDKNIDI